MTPPAHRSWRRRLVGFLLLWLVYAAAMTPVRFFLGWAMDGTRPVWPDPVIEGVLLGLVICVVTSVTPRWPGDGAAEKATRRAISRGSLPADVDRPAVRAGLLHVKRLVTSGRRWGVPLLAVVTVGVAALAVVRGLDGAGLFVTGLCAATLVVLVWLSSRQLRRVDRLLAELDAGAAAPEADRAGP
jgi:hypothetical protein